MVAKPSFEANGRARNELGQTPDCPTPAMKVAIELAIGVFFRDAVKIGSGETVAATGSVAAQRSLLIGLHREPAVVQPA